MINDCRIPLEHACIYRMKNGLSLIVPCYNEAGHLLNSYKKIVQELKRLKLPYEIIFVEDKSVDNTIAIIKSIVKKDKLTKAIFHKENVGRGGAVMDGILAAKYDYVGFIDIDLEVSESYINLFVKELKKGTDVVIARRSYSFKLKLIHRHIGSRFYAYLEKLVLNIPFHDTEAGYKFFKKSKILPILKQIKNKGWFWDTEIVVRSYLNNLSIKEIPVIFNRRDDKKSTVKFFSDSIDYLINLAKFRWTMLKNINKSDNYWENIPEQFTNSYTKKRGFGYFVYLFLSIRMKKVFTLLKNISLNRKKILDVGCGGGHYMEYFIKMGGKTTGIDSSPKMIALANKYLKKKGYEKFSLYKADSRKIPFSNGSFDLIIAIGTLEYLSNPEMAIAEINRVLKPGGYAVFSFTKKQTPFFFLRIFPGTILKKRLLNLPELSSTFSLKDVANILKGANFEIKKYNEVLLTQYLVLCQKSV